MTRDAVNAAIAAALVIIACGVAAADEATGRDLYQQGQRAYNIGQFDRAIDLFTQAYEQWPTSALLYNIGQAYRQAGNCKRARFFYSRYLDEKSTDQESPLPPDRKQQIVDLIAGLDECMKRELAAAPPGRVESTESSPPTNTATGTPTTSPSGQRAAVVAVAAATPEDDEGDGTQDERDEDAGGGTAPETGRHLGVRAFVGASKLFAGRLEAPPQLTVGAAGGYPLRVHPDVDLELGGAFVYTALPYTTRTNVHVSGGLIALLAHTAASHVLRDRILLRGEVGLGLLLISGLDHDANPFTADGMSGSGMVATFEARFAIGGDYAVTDNITVTAVPLALTLSPAPASFSSSFSALVTYSFVVGVGYRR